MCAIIGALVWNVDGQNRLRANDILNHIFQVSHERGRDGRGVMVNTCDGGSPFWWKSTKRVEEGDIHEFIPFLQAEQAPAVVISNLRAEPTTEYVEKKQSDDQQPYYSDPWTIVHNGTIANDKDLRTYSHPTKIDSAAISEHLASFKSDGSTFDHFYRAIQDIKGSFAILANKESEPNHILAAVNYRPLWWIKTDIGIFFASTRSYFPKGPVPEMIEPYTVVSFIWDGVELQVTKKSLLKYLDRHKALVVCSGGLDSSIAATFVKRVLKYETELIHFCYGSRAEGPEVIAVKAVGEVLRIPVIIFPLPIYKPEDSPLLQSDSKLAGGEAGAEFAYEWVPARNLLLLSVATAYAEAHGFDIIVLGNNLEEAGAYPDNEPEFISRFNDLLPFAVGDGKQVRVIMPVGNLMKHEIVALGHKINAPLDKTWSCYRAGKLHCGTCGPCYMRRVAFEINGLPEVISYERNYK